LLSGWTVGSVPDALGAVAVDIQRASGLTEAAGVAGAARAPAGRFSGDPCAPAEACAGESRDGGDPCAPAGAVLVRVGTVARATTAGPALLI
jgi:hypothetical protein